MIQGSTLFLKVVIYCIALLVLAICVILLGNAFANPDVGMYFPLLIDMTIAAIPFLYGLYQGLVLLRNIDKNTAFTAQSVQAIEKVKYCACTISVLYAIAMPYAIWAADKDDAPGVVLLWLVLTFAPFVVGVFAAVLQRVFQSAMDIKSENDLTV